MENHPCLKPLKNSWFDRDIIYWWIMNVFWPHHLKYQVNFNAILTLENFTAHDMKQFFLPTHLGIKLMPTKVNNWFLEVYSID